MDEDEARDEMDAANLRLEISWRKTVSLSIFSCGLIVWLIMTLLFNTWFQEVTHVGFLGLVVLVMLECLVGFIVYREFNLWSMQFTGDDET